MLASGPELCCARLDVSLHQLARLRLHHLARGIESGNLEAKAPHSGHHGIPGWNDVPLSVIVGRSAEVQLYEPIMHQDPDHNVVDVLDAAGLRGRKTGGLIAVWVFNEVGGVGLPVLRARKMVLAS